MRAGVAHEPLVGLDRDRAVGAVLVAEQRRRDALAVAAVAQLAEELVDEVAAVGEDQHAAGARGLDEAERGDGLAGAGRVLEPEALGGVGVLGLLGELLLVLGDLGVLVLVPVGERRLGLGAVELGLELGGDVLVVVVVLLVVLVGGAREDLVVLVVLVERRLVLVVLVVVVELGSARASLVVLVGAAPPRRRGSPRRRARRRPPLACAVAADAQRLGEQRGQRARERVDLVGGERRAVGELGLLLGEHPLEAQQQRVLAPPGGRGVRAALGQLGERRVERAAARRARRERDGALLAGVDERLARELLRARDVGIAGKGHSGHWCGIGHRGSVRQERRSRWQRRGDSAAVCQAIPAARPRC